MSAPMSEALAAPFMRRVALADMEQLLFAFTRIPYAREPPSGSGIGPDGLYIDHGGGRRPDFLGGWDRYHGRMPLRIGHGYDLHRLEAITPGGAAKPFVLAGVGFDHPLGPVGHSDGDALLHAVTDAILGALAMPDIGQLFPNTDPRWEDAPSRVFLEEARRRMEGAGYRIGNLDCTVICERPKVSPMKDELRRSIAETLGVGVEKVNVKGKTHELLADRSETSVEVHVVALLERDG